MYRPSENPKGGGRVPKAAQREGAPHTCVGPAGDVPILPDHTSTSPLAVQRTKTQDYVKGSGRRAEWCPGQPSVEPYVHYRLVLETLGQPLNTFKSTRQLCEVIRDVIVGK